MSDNLAIAAAIAGRFATATPPVGQPDIVACTHLLPIGLGGTPSIMVFPPDEPDIQLAMSTRIKLQTYPVRLYLVSVPYEGPDLTNIYGWQAAVQDVILLNSQLGIDGVAFAHLSVMRTGDITYGGIEYLGLDMVVTVKVSEGVQPVA